MSHTQYAFSERAIASAGKRGAEQAVLEIAKLIKKNTRFIRGLERQQAVAVGALKLLVSINDRIPNALHKRVLRWRKSLDYAVARRDEIIIQRALKAHALEQEKQVLERAILLCAESLSPLRILITHEIMDAEQFHFTAQAPVPALVQ